MTDKELDNLLNDEERMMAWVDDLVGRTPAKGEGSQLVQVRPEAGSVGDKSAELRTSLDEKDELDEIGKKASATGNQEGNELEHLRQYMLRHNLGDVPQEWVSEIKQNRWKADGYINQVEMKVFVRAVTETKLSDEEIAKVREDAIKEISDNEIEYQAYLANRNSATLNLSKEYKEIAIAALTQLKNIGVVTTFDTPGSYFVESTLKRYLTLGRDFEVILKKMEDSPKARGAWMAFAESLK